MSADRSSPVSARSPLDIEGVLWIAALDRVPIEERVEWVATMRGRVAKINAARASAGVCGAMSPGGVYSCILPHGHAEDRHFAPVTGSWQS